MKKKLSAFIKKWPLEGFIWLGALFILYIFEPGGGSHFSLCAFSWTGLDICPGCGLGTSISYFFDGDIVASFASHPLGIPAVFILLHRVFNLFRNNLIKKPYVEST